MRVATTTMCVDDATMMKRWAPFGPPDKFNASDGTASAAWVLASVGGKGVRRGECQEGDTGTLLVVQLGSRCSSQTHDGDVLMACCLVKKCGTRIIKICCNTNLGTGNTMVVSELTGGGGHFGGVISILKVLEMGPLSSSLGNAKNYR